MNDGKHPKFHLELHAHPPYPPQMLGKPTPLSPAAPPASWVEALESGETDIVAGQIVPLEPLLDELRASIARMEAKQALKSNKQSKHSHPDHHPQNSSHHQLT